MSSSRQLPQPPQPPELALGVAAACCLVLSVGCYETFELEAQRLAQPTLIVALQDADCAPVASRLDVRLQPAAVGVDLLLDWSGLHHDLQGQPLDPGVDAQRAMLYHFRVDDLDSLLEGIEQGTLAQSAVDLQVSCQTESSACLLSDFTFMAGHEIDVVERFVEGDGIWLVAVQRSDGGETVAYLGLEPSEGSDNQRVEITDDSGARSYRVDLEGGPGIELPAVSELLLDWSGLTLDVLGDPVLSSRLDLLTLARLPHDALDQGLIPMQDLPWVAEEVWVGDARGFASFPVAELVDLDSGAQGFPGLGGEGSWVLTLGCSACDDTLPAFVVSLEDGGKR